MTAVILTTVILLALIDSEIVSLVVLTPIALYGLARFFGKAMKGGMFD